MNHRAAADTLYGVGHWLLDQARHDDATHVFRTMLALASTDERAWLALGICHERSGELEKAARLYALCPSACDGATRCLIALARVLSRLGRHEGAEAAYERASRLAEGVDDVLSSVVAAERAS